MPVKKAKEVWSRLTWENFFKALPSVAMEYVVWIIGMWVMWELAMFYVRVYMELASQVPYITFWEALYYLYVDHADQWQAIVIGLVTIGSPIWNILRKR